MSANPLSLFVQRKALGLLPLLALILAGITGCNTTAGFGEDLEEAGATIEQEAEQSKPY